MNIKSYTNESLQRGSKCSNGDKKESKIAPATTTTIATETATSTESKNKEVVVVAGSKVEHVVVVKEDKENEGTKEEEQGAEAIAETEAGHETTSPKSKTTNKDKVYVATATANHLNIEAIEQASMVAINNNNNNNSSSSSSRNTSNNNTSNNISCNKFKQQPRQRRTSQSDSDNNNKYSNNYNNSKSNNYIDVQTFTNTKELNQVNLNSSSTTTTSPSSSSSSSQSSLATSVEAAATAATVTTTTTATIKSSSYLASAAATEIAWQQQQHQQQQQQLQQQQLIMSPTALALPAAAAVVSAAASSTATATVTTTSSVSTRVATTTTTTTTIAVNLRKSHSTPALKFDVSSNIVNDYSTDNSNNNNNTKLLADKCAMEASNITNKDVAVVAHLKRQQHQQQQQLQQFEHFSRLNDSSCNGNCINNNNNISSSNNNSSNNCNAMYATQPTTPESLRFGCTHYKRRAMFVTPCCNKFYKCRYCHDENESHHFDRKTLTELICSECNTRQKVQEQCEQCGVRFGKYTCLICNLFDDADKQQYHCHGCGICRIGGAHNFFHCEVCNMCLPIQLKIDGHRCVENISRSHCPVCLGDIHTSRIPCHIPDCGHLLHKMCFDQLLASGHYTCPTCQTSLIDMTALWEYLDAQALRMPVPLKYENQRVHIFCNDCHKTSKTKFHFIGLKCVHCGAYNTTQDVKRRLSLVTDEPSTA